LIVAVLWLAIADFSKASCISDAASMRLALLGTTTLIALALIRDVSLHQIDVLPGGQTNSSNLFNFHLLLDGFEKSAETRF
jgi:hypothetical protein